MIHDQSQLSSKLASNCHQNWNLTHAGIDYHQNDHENYNLTHAGIDAAVLETDGFYLKPSLA